MDKERNEPYLLVEKLYYQMFLVRSFEERILDLFSKGSITGTTHCCIGQEAIGVAVMNYLREEDIVVSNHRCHGHYLSRTEDVEGLMAELMGDTKGICAGRGGSQHLCKNNFYTNGILGSTVPLAAGMAFAEMKKRSDAITVLFMGDGAFGQGVVYETLNMISLWQIPILIVVENNFYAQSTHISLNCAGSLLKRAEAFGISVGETESNDPEELYHLFGRIIGRLRDKRSPHMQIVHTYRFCSHSKSDDCRLPSEIEFWAVKDPLKVLGQRLSHDTKARLENRAAIKVEEAESRLTKKLNGARF